MTAPTFTTLIAGADWCEDWLRQSALPLWASAGVELRSGTFQEALTLQGQPVAAPRRARVQARQVMVYARAAAAGFGADWLEVARRGFAQFKARHQRADGLFAILTDEAGGVLDETPCLYEQAFALSAMAALAAADGGSDVLFEAERLLAALNKTHRHDAGGFREFGPQPFQSNAHMHLLEAALAWEQLGAGDGWRDLADEIVGLCLARFIDPTGGFLREFFDAHWRAAPGDDGRWVEPGHQFEWAWLLERWGRARGQAVAAEAARRLFAAGLRGVDRVRGVAVDVLWDDLSVREPTARLWPQTEYLKAALILGEEAEALTAVTAIARYLAVPVRGAWRDRMLADGSFLEQPSPASSFYHLMEAILELRVR